MHDTPFAFVAFAACMLAVPAVAQDGQDARLKSGFDAWQLVWNSYADAMAEARAAGKITKGGALPAEVQERLDAADAARAALIAEFGTSDELSAASFRLLATLHERGRDYAAAVLAYEHALRAGDPKAPDLTTLRALCIAAMNSKDDARAAHWMAETIACEDRATSGRPDYSVRTSFYPRALIALDRFDRLAEHLEKLAADDAPACQAAAATFGVVLAVHRHELDEAQRRVDAIRAEPQRFPDHQAWAVLAQLALSASRGEFDDAARRAQDFVAEEVPAGGSATDRNQRRYLAAVAPFLGKLAPAVQVDEWVGSDAEAGEVLGSLRGKVVVLDFWQPWCEPCRNAMPHLVALQQKHPDELRVIGICKVESYGYDVSEKRAVRPIEPDAYAAHVADFRTDMALNYPLAIAKDGGNSERYSVVGIPTLVVIDRDGVVRYMSCGAGEPGLMELAIEGVLARR